MRPLRICPLVALATLLLAGCALISPPLPEPMSSAPQPPRTAAAPPQPGSLYSPDSPSRLLSDLRARDVGDIITVRVMETSRASRKASTKTDRASEIQGGVDNFLGLAEGFLGNNSGLNGSSLVKGSLGNKFQGSGETSGESTMTAYISMRVVEVLPNGNLVIAGSRRTKINNEDQVIVLSGVVRPADISPDNTVVSSYVADARIEYYGRGVVADKQRPGWLARVVDWAWPF
jgi:flagellar L-ring protein precursor FlgH